MNLQIDARLFDVGQPRSNGIRITPVSTSMSSGRKADVLLVEVQGILTTEIATRSTACCQNLIVFLLVFWAATGDQQLVAYLVTDLK